MKKGIQILLVCLCMPFQLATADISKDLMNAKLPLEVLLINAIAEGVATGECAGASGRTNGRGGVEAVELHASLRHGVEVRGRDDLVAIETDIAPAKVVAHHQDDVRLRLCGNSRWRRDEAGAGHSHRR